MLWLQCDYIRLYGSVLFCFPKLSLIEKWSSSDSANLDCLMIGEQVKGVEVYLLYGWWK